MKKLLSLIALFLSIAVVYAAEKGTWTAGSAIPNAALKEPRKDMLIAQRNV